MKKILVLIKATPDTEAKITIDSSGKSIDTAGIKFIINPYDEYAIEEALNLKTKFTDAEVVIASIGQPSIKETIIKALAMGGDRGLLVNFEPTKPADSLAYAKIAKAVIESESPNIVFAGRHAIDDDNMHVATMTAELLGWPHVNIATQFSTDGKTAEVTRGIESGMSEVYSVSLPAIIGADKALNKPRYASLPGIMKAKKKPFDEKTPADLGLGNVEDTQGSIEITGLSYPPEKPPGKIFQGDDVGALVDQLVDALKNEAKVL